MFPCSRPILFVLPTLAMLLLATVATARAQDEATLHEQLRVAIENATIDMDYDEVAFGSVVEDITRQTGLNIIIDQQVIEDCEDEEISLSLRGLTVKNALEIVCEFVEMKYTFRYGVIFITSPERAYQGATVLKIYDVRDLTFKIKDFAGTRIRLRGNDTGGGGGVIFEDEEEEFEPVSVDDLEDMIPDAVSPDSWDENPDAMILQVAGMLLVRQTPEVHAEIQRLLSQLRENR